MRHAHLEIVESNARRVVALDRDSFTIGRLPDNDLRLDRPDVSRTHAEIARDGERFVLKDRSSRYGTFVNGNRIAEHALCHGDTIRLGQASGAELLFACDETGPADTRASAVVVSDLRHVALLLEGLRALGAGGVLDEVLALVLDSAIEMSGAERGFIMLADAAGQLEFKLARGAGRITLPGRTFATSRKIPEQVHASGETRAVTDLLDADLSGSHTGTIALGIRHVFCVPLRLARYVEVGASADGAGARRPLGVLYLDSRERGSLLSSGGRAALETLAGEAAVAIENARLYREAAEKARLEQELKIAARIQQSLLPQGHWAGPHFEAMASSHACRSIGGDFFEYVALAPDVAGFALGDVAGKGAPAALLAAVLQGVLTAQAAMPGGAAETLSRINQAMLRRAVESRFATMFYAALCADGRLTYSNAGHNPPVLAGRSGITRLEAGGVPLGLFERATYQQASVAMEPGDTLVVFSDGISEALSETGEDYGEQRLVACVDAHRSDTPAGLVDRLLAEVRAFTGQALQHDDMTVLVVRYGR